MSYEVKQGNIFGRIGSSLGKGLAEQIPQEAKQQRLAAGLKQFEQDSSGLSPLQQLSRLASIPGALEHPQLIESAGRLGQLQARANAFSKQQDIQNQPRPSPFPSPKSSSATPGSDIPSITKEEPLEKIQEGFIPRNEEEKLQAAGKRYNSNPQLFGNDPQKALDYENQIDATNEKITQSYQTKHKNLTDIQNNVVERLKDHSGRLGVQIPANVYSKIEDKAIQDTKPKSQGGGGLTEQQSMKKYGEELDKISRDYKAIDTIGDWAITGRKAIETLRDLQAIQKDFEERGDTENMADTMIAKNKVSPLFAYSVAQPVYRVKELNDAIKKLPGIQSKLDFKKGFPSIPISQEKVENATLQVSKKLAPLFKGNERASPLAVARELEKKGYDPEVFMNYLIKNRDDLNFSEKQGRQLNKPGSFTGTMNDWWLQEWSGLDK